MEKARVVVTGLGTVTSLGVGRKALWTNLLAGKSGLTRVSSFDTRDYPVDLGGEIHDFDADTLLKGADASDLGRASQLGLAAALLALDDAGIDTSAVARENAGIAMGTTSGEPNEIERLDELWVDGKQDRIDPDFVRRYPCHVIPVNIARCLGTAGPNTMLPAACAAGNYAIGWAADLIGCGRAELMLAGGADAFSRITYSGFAQLNAIAPEKCQPFDKNRKGMVPGEGAAVLILESLDHAVRRGAPIYCEVVGYGLSCDAHHITAAHPQGDGARRAMSKAIAAAGLQTADIDYISAHGTGTPGNDHRETLAVKALFGKSAYDIPMSSVKSMLGHTMGAASAIEAAVCALALSEQKVPPTINYETPDPDCDLDYVPNHARALAMRYVMNNAYAFGGNNSSVVFGRWREESS